MRIRSYLSRVDILFSSPPRFKKFLVEGLPAALAYQLLKARKPFYATCSYAANRDAAFHLDKSQRFLSAKKDST